MVDSHNGQNPKIGIFGGTFDPFHSGHLGVIRHAKQQLKLTDLYVVPNHRSPLKLGAHLSPDQRMALLETMAQSENFRIGRWEIDRLPPSFTIDTITNIQSECGSAPIYLIIGTDNWKIFTSWKSYSALLARVTIVVADRGESSEIQPIDGVVPHRLMMPKIPISSAEIWQKLARNESVSSWIPPEISDQFWQYVKRTYPELGLPA